MCADQVHEECGGAVHDADGGSHQLHSMKVSSALKMASSGSFNAKNWTFLKGFSLGKKYFRAILNTFLAFWVLHLEGPGRILDLTFSEICKSSSK